MVPVVTPALGDALPSQPAGEPHRHGRARFKERLDGYVKVHHEAESKVPKLTETNDPAKVARPRGGARRDDQEPAADGQGRRRLRRRLPAGARAGSAQRLPQPLGRRSQGTHPGAAGKDEDRRQHDLSDRTAAGHVPGAAAAEAARPATRARVPHRRPPHRAARRRPPTSSSTSPATSSRPSRAEAAHVDAACPPRRGTARAAADTPRSARCRSPRRPRRWPHRRRPARQAAAAANAGRTRPSRRTPRSRCASPSSATPAPAARRSTQVGERLSGSRTVFPFEFVLMLGDNIYGGERPQDFVKKFEQPYKALLDLKIPFYASLGNHDDPEPALLQAVQHGRRSATTPSRRTASASSRSTATTWTRRSRTGSRRS